MAEKLPFEVKASDQEIVNGSERVPGDETDKEYEKEEERIYKQCDRDSRYSYLSFKDAQTVADAKLKALSEGKNWTNIPY